VLRYNTAQPVINLGQSKAALMSDFSSWWSVAVMTDFGFMPNVTISCLPPNPRGPRSLRSEGHHDLRRVVLGPPTGLLQSAGGLSRAAITRWWSSSGAVRERFPKKRSLSDPTRPTWHWWAGGDASYCIVSSVPGVWNTEDLPQAQGVESIKASCWVMVHLSHS